MCRIGGLIFPGFELLDLFGPVEMFGMRADNFTLKLISETGGPGTRREAENARLLDWIAEASHRAELSLSVYTGSALLAKAFVPYGHRAATNKTGFAWVAEQRPCVTWIKQARGVQGGAMFTSSGVSVGMDMTLGVLSHLMVRDAANGVARRCEYNWQDRPNDAPFVEVHGLA